MRIAGDGIMVFEKAMVSSTDIPTFKMDYSKGSSIVDDDVVAKFKVQSASQGSSSKTFVRVLATDTWSGSINSFSVGLRYCIGTSTSTGLTINADGITGDTRVYNSLRVDGSIAVAGSSMTFSNNASIAQNGQDLEISNDGANEIIVQQTSGGVKLTDGATAWSAVSDRRLKTNLVPIPDALERVSLLAGYTGRYKTDKKKVSRSFLVAQEVKEALPEAVSKAKKGGMLSVRYAEIIPLLVQAINELKEEVDQLKKDVANAL